MSYWRTLGLSFVLFSAPAFADEPVQVPPELRSLSAAEVDARLADAERLLDDGELYGDLWWYGWTSFYAIGVVFQTVEVATDGNDSDGREADKIVGAVKATGGVVSQLIRGSATADGADPVRELPSATAEDRLYRLAVAEHQLRARAKESDGRFSLLRHGMNVAVNVAGAMIVWQGFEARTRAWRSAATGIAVGEIMIWTIPWYGRSELEQYEQRHNVRVPQGPRVSWGIAPSLNGASVQLRF